MGTTLLAVILIGMFLLSFLICALSNNFKPLFLFALIYGLTFVGFVYFAKFMVNVQMKKVDELRRACFD